VRQPDDDRFGDARVGGVERLLDLDRGDVLTTGLDDILAAVGEPQDPVGVEAPDVTGMEPAVGERRVGGLRVVEVAGEGVWSPVDDLTLLARRQQGPLLVHDRGLHVDHRRADRPGVAELVLRPEQGGGGAHLGLPEQQVEVTAEALDAAAQLRLRHGRHRVEGAPQAGQVGLVQVGVLQQLPVHHRQPEDLGDPLGLDQRQQPGGVKAALDEHGRADQHRGGAVAVELRGVEHRHHRHEPVGFVEAGLHRHRQRLQVDGGVAADDPLGEGGGAAGVEVAERVPVIDEALGFGVVVGGEVPERHRTRDFIRTRGAVPARPRCHDDVADARLRAHRLSQRREQLALDDDAPGTAVPEDVADFVRAPAKVDGHTDHPELGAGVVGDQELDAVAGGEGERVAAAVTAPGKAAGDPVDQAVELLVGQLPAPVGERECRRIAGRGPGQAVTDVDALDEVAVQLGR
jgi:hypothetical protein